MNSNERPLVPPSFFLRARSRAVFPRTAMGFGILGLLLMFSLAAAGQPGNDTIVKKRPYMGWSTWSLQAHFGTSEPTGDAFENEVNVKANSDAMRSTGLQAHGFEYINVDGDWDYGLMCQCGDPMGWDAYGRPVGDPQRFPSGMAALAAHIHGNGQKAGIYWEGGIPPQVYAANTPILGTTYHVQDIALKPLTTEFNSFYVIDFTKPGAQEYIDSIIQEFAEWGYDYLKVDGVKNIDRDNVAAISKAIRKAGRPMYLNLSSNLNHDLAGWWERFTSGRRIDGDIECSRRTCTTALTWWWNSAAGPATGTGSAPAGIFARFTDPLVTGWVDDYGNGPGWNDYDSLEVGNGSITTYPTSSAWRHSASNWRKTAPPNVSSAVGSSNTEPEPLAQKQLEHVHAASFTRTEAACQVARQAASPGAGRCWHGCSYGRYRPASRVLARSVETWHQASRSKAISAAMGH